MIPQCFVFDLSATSHTDHWSITWIEGSLVALIEVQCTGLPITDKMIQSLIFNGSDIVLSGQLGWGYTVPGYEHQISIDKILYRTDDMDRDLTCAMVKVDFLSFDTPEDADREYRLLEDEMRFEGRD